MNKATKGAIAAGAASLILLGGAGSYALWTDSASTPAGTVTAGVLDIEPIANSSEWRDISAGTPGTVITPAITNPATAGYFLMVPGDVLEYTASFTIKATGNNLSATVNAVPGSITYGGTLTAAQAPVTTTATIGGVPVNGNVITSSAVDKTVVVKSTVTFDRNTANQVGQSGTVNLAGFQIGVQQTRA